MSSLRSFAPLLDTFSTYMYTRQNSLHFMLLTGFSLAGENAYVMPSLYYHPSAMKIITNKVKLSSYGRDSMHGTLIHIKNDRCVTWLLSLLGLKLLLKTATEIIPRESGCKILRKDVQIGSHPLPPPSGIPLSKYGLFVAF